MLNQIVLWQAMIIGWVRDRLSDRDDPAQLGRVCLLLALIAVVAIGPLVCSARLSARR